MLTYEIDPEELQPHVPQGLSLDQWEGRCLISVIGLQFLGIRMLGIPVPFYVRRECQGQWRRDVVFIKQIVPYYLLALAARRVYRERFVAMPMQHSVETSDSRETLDQVSYQWRHLGAWGRMAVRSLGSLERANSGSVEEFVAEHY